LRFLEKNTGLMFFANLVLLTVFNG